jgi:FKBP-type peptidyl-prolyl cis-trans isomerase (trigger factor)
MGMAVALATLALAVGGCSGSPPPSVGTTDWDIPEGAIALVGDDVVTLAEYEQAMAEAEARYGASGDASSFPPEGTVAFDELKASIIDRLVDNALTRQGASDLGLTVTPEEVTARVAEIKKELGGQAQLDTYIEGQGLTPERYGEQIRADLLETKVREKAGGSQGPLDDEAWTDWLVDALGRYPVTHAAGYSGGVPMP